MRKQQNDQNCATATDSDVWPERPSYYSGLTLAGVEKNSDAQAARAFCDRMHNVVRAPTEPISWQDYSACMEYALLWHEEH